MISKETYSLEWIEACARKTGKVDRKLLEKVIMALTLLEQLVQHGLRFTFKGGTALILLFDTPKRFSIDIDIIIEEKTHELPDIFDQIVNNSPFDEWESDERHHEPDLPVAHYKFYYRSLIDTHFDKEPILLDILFGASPYPRVQATSIQNKWLVTEEPITQVYIPTPEGLLGDKMTAFAPNTTGILYTKNRPVEIIKQLFDIGELFEIVEDLPQVAQTFNRVAKEELAYRGRMDLTSQDVLDDMFETSMILCLRDQKAEPFQTLMEGVRGLVNFIFPDRFVLEKAMIRAAKAAYLSQLIQREYQTIPHRFQSPEQINDILIEDPDFNKLNKLRKSVPEAFFY